MASDIAIDDRILTVNGICELYSGFFLNDQPLAADSAHDFAVAADGEVSRAIHASSEITMGGEVVAVNSDAGDSGFLVDDYITTRLDSAIPVRGNFVVLQ